MHTKWGDVFICIEKSLIIYHLLVPVSGNLLGPILAGEPDIEEVAVVADGAKSGADVGLKLVPPQAELVRRSHDGRRRRHTLSQITHSCTLSTRLMIRC